MANFIKEKLRAYREKRLVKRAATPKVNKSRKKYQKNLNYAMTRVGGGTILIMGVAGFVTTAGSLAGAATLVGLGAASVVSAYGVMRAIPYIGGEMGTSILEKKRERKHQGDLTRKVVWINRYTGQEVYCTKAQQLVLSQLQETVASITDSTVSPSLKQKAQVKKAFAEAAGVMDAVRKTNRGRKVKIYMHPDW